MAFPYQLLSQLKVLGSVFAPRGAGLSGKEVSGLFRLSSWPLQSLGQGSPGSRAHSQLAGWTGITQLQGAISHGYLQQGAASHFGFFFFFLICLQDGVGSLLGTEFPGFEQTEKKNTT